MGIVAVAAEDLADAEAVEVGQHEIEQDDVGPVGADAVNGFPAVGGGGHIVARPDQMILHQVGELGFVVYGEDFGTGGRHRRQYRPVA